MSLTVIARTGIKVPMEGKPKSYILDSVAVEVQDSHYYRRRIDDGDLIEVAAQVASVAGGGNE